MNPKIVFDAKVYRKIRFWVDLANEEVSGLGKVIWDDKTGAFRVVSAIMLPQKNSAATTDIEPEDVARAMFEMRNEPGDLNFWWHSHVHMGVFWSGTDMDTIKSFGSGGYIVASVFNKKEEMRSAYYSVQHRFPVFLDDLKNSLEYMDETATWKEEYERNVQKKILLAHPTHPTPHTPYWSPQLRTWVQPSATTPTTPPHGTGRTPITEEEKRRALIEGKRPASMSKREWKDLKRLNRERMQAEIEAERAEDEVLRREDSEYVAPYPFTQEELLMLAAEGVDYSEIEYMLEHEYSREDILAFIGKGNSLSSDAPEDFLDDVPVADRKYYGNDLQ